MAKETKKMSFLMTLGIQSKATEQQEMTRYST
jgi:hypothetical protein